MFQPSRAQVRSHGSRLMPRISHRAFQAQKPRTPQAAAARWIASRPAAIERWLVMRGYRPRGLRLPDFLCIGAQKAGTTWLGHNLRFHPEIFLPEQMEQHYFNRESYKPLSYYAEPYRDAGSRLAGDKTPAYALLSDRHIAYIQRLMPEARIIFLLRNPVDRAWSHAKMEFATRKQVDLAALDPGEIIRFLERPHCRNRGLYSSQIDRWRNRFPEEQFHIGFFDDLKLRPRGLLEDVMRFLGVTTDIDWSRVPYGEVVHGNPHVPIPPVIRSYLQEQFAEEVERLHARFGDRVAGWRTGAEGVSRETAGATPLTSGP